MTEQQKQAIIESGKQYFRSIIIPNHLKNLNKLHLSSFDINPFLINYLAAFIKEDSQIIGLAKALVYPYIYDKVIDASSEQNVQSLVSLLQEVTGGASNFDGIDFEFVDAVDVLVELNKSYSMISSTVNLADEDKSTLEEYKKEFGSASKEDLEYLCCEHIFLEDSEESFAENLFEQNFM